MVFRRAASRQLKRRMEAANDDLWEGGREGGKGGRKGVPEGATRLRRRF